MRVVARAAILLSPASKFNTMCFSQLGDTPPLAF